MSDPISNLKRSFFSSSKKQENGAKAMARNHVKYFATVSRHLPYLRRSYSERRDKKAHSHPSPTIFSRLLRILFSATSLRVLLLVWCFSKILQIVADILGTKNRDSRTLLGAGKKRVKSADESSDYFHF